LTACIFCKILRGEAPASFVHRDAQVSAFMDIRPVTLGHVLVVPNTHAARLADLDAETGGRMFASGQAVAAALHASGRSDEGGIRCEGVNFFLADGGAAGQEVDHVHLHVFPRYAGDGFGLRLPPNYGLSPRAALDAAAEAIRKAFGRA
jgi:diadenosine tetraphosphate (Ap4A) HIT family hydrolase